MMVFIDLDQWDKLSKLPFFKQLNVYDTKLHYLCKHIYDLLYFLIVLLSLLNL